MTAGKPITRLATWTFLRLVAYHLPILIAILYPCLGNGWVGVCLLLTVPACMFFLISYRETRPLLTVRNAIRQTLISHGLASGILLLNPKVWSLSGGHPPLPAYFVVIPWVLGSALISAMGVLLAILASWCLTPISNAVHFRSRNNATANLKKDEEE